MKALIIISVLLLTSAFSQPLAAQTKDANSSVFVELLGNGLIYSINYDTRFSSRQDGIGGKVGISYMAVEGVNFATIPIMANYLLGKNGKFFEVGVGTTYLAIAERNDTVILGNNPWERGDGWIGTMTLGYRSQPVDGGFLFRAGITPIFGGGGFWPLYPQLSFGYAF